MRVRACAGKIPLYGAGNGFGVGIMEAWAIHCCILSVRSSNKAWRFRYLRSLHRWASSSSHPCAVVPRSRCAADRDRFQRHAQFSSSTQSYSILCVPLITLVHVQMRIKLARQLQDGIVCLDSMTTE